MGFFEKCAMSGSYCYGRSERISAKKHDRLPMHLMKQLKDEGSIAECRFA
jgi:hypothetical protein